MGFDSQEYSHIIIYVILMILKFFFERFIRLVVLEYLYHLLPHSYIVW